MAYSFSPLKQKISETEEWLRKEFSMIRTGRATPVILDSIKVDSYGAKMAINQIGSVNVEDPKTLRIIPWDTTQIKNVEKAVIDANLGLSVTADEKGLRIIFPELTSERRQALVKITKQKLEEARITLRVEREKIWDDIQGQEKKGTIGEDDKFRYKDEMQKIIDGANKNLEETGSKKEKEILEG
jgi:ribosome recycling factor